MNMTEIKEKRRPKPLTPKAGLTNDIRKKEIKKKK